MFLDTCSWAPRQHRAASRDSEQEDVEVGDKTEIRAAIKCISLIFRELLEDKNAVLLQFKMRLMKL